MTNRTPTILPLLVGALLLVPPAGAASSPLKGGLDVAPDVGFDGDVSATTQDGLVHAELPNLRDRSIQLDADRIRIDTEWLETTRASAPTGQAFDVGYDTGNDTYVFEDAQLELEPFQDRPELLAIASDGGSIQSGASDHTNLGLIENENLTQIGVADNAESPDDDEPGFWYHVGGPSLHFDSLDQATISGDFALFVHNVTMVVDEEESSETWRNWTGQQYESEDSPVSEYEIRVSVIQVTGGTLTVDAEDEISMIGRESSANVNGQIKASGAQGELIGEELQYRFEEGALDLEGQGQIDAMSPAVAGFGGGLGDTPVSDPITLKPDGQFEVDDGGPGVTVSSVPAAESAETDELSLVAGALALVLAGLFLARGRLRPLIDKVRAHVRERRVEQWMEAGDRLTSVRDYAKAHTYYERITDRYPEVAEAWYAKGVVLSELDRHGEAADAFEEANQRIGGDPELLDLSAREAWHAGDEERARALFEELSVKDPMRLRERLNEPEFAELREKSWIEAMFEPDEEDLSSYA